MNKQRIKDISQEIKELSYSYGEKLEEEELNNCLKEIYFLSVEMQKILGCNKPIKLIGYKPTEQQAKPVASYSQKEESVE